jgi:hypothetical protein
MVADEPSQDIAPHHRASDLVQQQTARLHGAREADRALSVPAQPPEDARLGGQNQHDQKIRAGRSDRSDDPHARAQQADEEHHLPKERDPRLKKGTTLFAALADR